MKLRYFAWVRERIGQSEEEIDLPDGIDDITELMAWLAGRDDGYAAAFAQPEIIRAAIDQEHADHSAPVRDAGEIAFFPPMTGG
jgi:molybdopterin synthase sulfur carrier subunit